MKKVMFLLLIVVLFGLSGCMHSVVGTYSRYPDTDNYKYCLLVNIHGASGRSYADETQKKIELNISDSAGSNKFHKVYRVTAADLKVDVQWDQINIVQVEFFDYAGADEYHAKQAGIPITKRLILSLKFIYDSKKDVFIETQAFEHELEEEGMVDHYSDNRASISDYEWSSWFYGKAVNYPLGCTFENQQYRLYFENLGPWRKWKWDSWASKDEESPRTVRIGIWDDSQKWKWVGATGNDSGCKLKKEYHVVAAEMDWEVEWENLDNLVIYVFDYGDGNSCEKAKKEDLPKRPILLLRYTYDAKKDIFVESEVKHLYASSN